MVALAAFYTPEIFESDRILTIEDDNGELEDVSPAYARECLDTWGDLIQFCDDWEAQLFTVSLSDYHSLPHITQACRRIHARWLNEQRAAQRKK